MSPHESILHLPTLLPQIAERVTISVEPYTLRFRRPAKTSRGEYETKRVYYLRLQSLEQPTHVGYGECAPMPQLSCDDLPNYQVVLEKLGGGGNATSAGGFVPGTDVETVHQRLLAAIDAYYQT